MLKRLKLKNFQIHRNLTIAFDPRVTSIVGPNGAGKSALIRALYWICFNKPAVTKKIISWGQSFVSAELNVGKHKITRRKGKKGNLYKIDSHILRAVGIGNVPEEVTKLLNISTSNFQNQLDLLYWFALTPGQIAKELNSIVDLSIIDEVQAKTAKELKQAKSRVDLSEERLKEARTSKQSLAWIVGIDRQLTSLEILAKRTAKIGARTTLLQQLVNSCDKAARVAHSANVAALHGDRTIKAGRQALIASKRVDRLGKLLSGAMQARADSLTSTPDIESLESTLNDATESNEKYYRLQSLVRQAEDAKKEVIECQKSIMEIETDLHKRLHGKCPLCGHQIP